MWSGRASSITISPPAMATADNNVAATTRSGMTRCGPGAGRSSSTPSTSMCEVPAPRMRAPIWREEGGQVRDLGLAGRVLDHRRPLGQHGGHEHVVGGGVARVLEHDPLPHQAPDGPPRHRALDVAVHRLEHRPQRRQAVEVDVDGAVPEVVATGQRHAGPSRAGQQRPEHHHRGAHLLDQLVGRLGDERGRRVDHEVRRRAVGPVGGPGHLRPDGGEHLGHDLDVDDARHTGQHVTARRQQARRHQLERRVLGAAGGHRPVQRPSGTDDEARPSGRRPDQTTGFSAHRPNTEPRAPTISPTVA